MKETSIKNNVKFSKVIPAAILLAVSAISGIGMTETGKCSRTFSEEKTKRINTERECKRDVDETSAWTDLLRFNTEQCNNTERYRLDKKNERQKRWVEFWDKRAGRLEDIADKVADKVVDKIFWWRV
ncbi:hypothetical protein [Ruminococcus albus]|uniref:Uncharacterized protein n=1 Tax=Ruminococcus albus TaxID=1264 RepID=A0A1I1R7N1_RUMAL|nr:hypothetical protein [Ruminococcus albus]SFD30252.1 hypothetical protein SAMN02910406_03621 [Ruminococcus albus]